MRKSLVLGMVAASLAAGLIWELNSTLKAAEKGPTAGSEAQISQLRARAKKLIGVLPAKMPGGEKDTPAQVDLGRKLYFDKILSANRTQSCNDCHEIDEGKGGADTSLTSAGAFGKNGTRNSPTVLNAGFQFTQFWDGRAATLEDQAKGPILNPIEMAMPSEKEVLDRLAADASYPTLFRKAFPETTLALTYDNVSKAIAAFERTLITHDRFDDFLSGNDQSLTSQEIQGLERFLSLGCATCHNGPVLGGNRYHKLGAAHPHDNKTDLGLYAITKDEADKFKFKVAMLRNIAITGPYFHDGQTTLLEEAVKKMAWWQQDVRLSEEDTKSLVAFLKTLTDKQREAK